MNDDIYEAFASAAQENYQANSAGRKTEENPG